MLMELDGSNNAVRKYTWGLKSGEIRGTGKSGDGEIGGQEIGGHHTYF